MGAYSTPGLLDAHMREWLLQHVALPTIAGMREEGAEYRGVLYCGLMMTARGPMVLEFNCRFGDPETQPILMRLETDLVDAVEASITGELRDDFLQWSNDSTACVVAVSGGYPEAFEAGKRITGLDEAAALENVKVFHAGTSFHNNEYFTSGGRVLGVTARAPELSSAVQQAYSALENIHFDGIYYRRDIAARALKASSS
jgi:phosphoribosylamine--glycine ligase